MAKRIRLNLFRNLTFKPKILDVKKRLSALAHDIDRENKHSISTASTAFNKRTIIAGVLYLPSGFFDYNRELQKSMLIAVALYHKEKNG